MTKKITYTHCDFYVTTLSSSVEIGITSFFFVITMQHGCNIIATHEKEKYRNNLSQISQLSCSMQGR